MIEQKTNKQEETKETGVNKMKETKTKEPQKQDSQEQVPEISAYEIEVRKLCGQFFAGLTNLSYLYGVNPIETEDLAEKWIVAVKEVTSNKKEEKK